MKIIKTKLIIVAFSTFVLLGCKKNLEIRSPSSGEVSNIIKFNDISESFKNPEDKSYKDLEEILADLTQENYLGRMTYNDLPITWWSGPAEIDYQSWSVTTDKQRIQITVYQSKSAPGRVINVNDAGDPSDYYLAPTKK